VLVFLSAEGKRDVGGLADPLWGDPADEGFFQPLIRRVVGPSTEFRAATTLSLGQKPPKTVKSKLAQRAHQAVALADALECDAVVIHTDVDERATTDAPPDGYKRRRDQLAAGVAAAGAARPPAVFALPIATTEAWALADPDAVRARSSASAHASDLDRLPETLWGKPHDPSSNHPKMLLERVLGRAASHREQRAISSVMDLDVARARCPRSLAPFLDELSAL